jgi:hypothetical protein
MSEQKEVELAQFDWERMQEVASDDLCTPEEHPDHESCMACLAIRGTRWALTMREALSSSDAQIAALTAQVAEIGGALDNVRDLSYAHRIRAEKAEAELAALREGATELCIPRDRSPLWLLIYDDPEVGMQEFAAEEEAREAYKKAIVNWNCSLYRPAERILDTTAAPASGQS